MEKTELKLGMQPFWFWNGDMKPEELERQIREMKAKGIPGFLIHPRQGMEIPYMSEEFFERVKLAVKLAKENDMEVWIYDEYPYPSGICGGEVILDHPEFLCKRLKKEVRDVKGGENVRMFAPWGKLLLARAYRIRDGKTDLEDFLELKDYVGTGYRQEVFQYSGLTKYNKKRYFTGDPGKLLCWTAPEGEWRIYLVTEVVLDHFKYFGNYIDTMNPEAIRCFISLTHERYREHVGEEFGKTIKGFFTDEITAFPDREPWSPLLPGRVKERYGIDLVSCLPAIWEDLGELSSRVRYAYWNTATDSFIESYDKQVYEWCEANHLLYIGEKPIMRSKELQYVHVPGIDSGHQKVGSRAKMVTERYRSNGKMISSAAHFYDKPAVLCEAGHSIGWGMTMQDMKWIFDWLAVQGVDFYVIHGFFYTTDGLKKHDAPPSAFFQMPWWEDARALTSYAKYLSNLLQSWKRQVKILVIDPVTSAWTSGAEEQRRLKEGFAQMQNRMLCEELDYYIIDPELFASGVVNVTEGKTTFRVHGEDYEAVLLPPMRNLEVSACEKVLEYAEKGGKTAAFGSVAFEKIEDSEAVGELGPLFDVDAAEVWKAFLEERQQESVEGENRLYAADLDSLTVWLKHICPPAWKICPLDKLGRDGLPSICGTDESGEEKLFLVNTRTEERLLEVTDPAGRTKQIRLQGLESGVIELDDEEPERVINLSLDGEMEFALSQKNALRLGTWTASLPDGQSHTVEAEPVIDQLEQGGFLRPVRQKTYFGCPKELDFEGTQICYRQEFLCEGVDTPVFLVFEPETFLGEWRIALNGHLLTEEDFKQKAFYLHTNLAAEVTGLLRAGRNQIEITVRTEVSYGGMRNPVYLFGEFGVEREDETWKLTPLKVKCSVEHMAEAGLPFYSGEIVFRRRLAPVENIEQPVKLKLDADWFSDSVRLRVGGYETEPCAWQPYVFEIPGNVLKKEGTDVELAVRTSAIALFEGQRFNRKTHSYEDYFAPLR